MFDLILKLFHFFLSLFAGKRKDSDSSKHFLDEFGETIPYEYIISVRSQRDEQEIFISFLRKSPRILYNMHRNSHESCLEIICHCLFVEEYWNVETLLQFYYAPCIHYDDLVDVAYMVSCAIREFNDNEGYLSDLIHPIEEKSFYFRRNFLYLQIILVFFNYEKNPDEEALKALCIIWRSISDAFITFDELAKAHKKNLKFIRPGFLEDTHQFYTKSISEEVSNHKPRMLKHYCRTVIRRTLYSHEHLPEGIVKLGVSEELQTYLKLEN